jgi:CrcB protein
MNLQTAIAIGSGGFFGAISRAYMIGVVNRFFPHSLPLGTLFVNLLGSLIMGFLFALFESLDTPPHIKSILTTGFLGAFTTYSTFAIESLWLIKSSPYLGVLNIILNALGCVLFAYIGYKFIWSYQ